ncbi:MAG TPA: PEP/pyruvate-binding domain-containing protein [Rhodospirillales bacterium]|jgi:pyruvate,water dikinase|nr:PEP/pyruvate-binding domain-containing protein [Rhodospirillales bacterium]
MSEASDYIVNLSDPAAEDAGRFGPKAANQAMLDHAGLPTPGGFCLSAQAYMAQVEALGLTEVAEKAVSLEFFDARPFISQIRIAMFDAPMIDEIKKPLIQAYRDLTGDAGMLVAVRSSSLMEDTEGSSFAGQFQTYLGIDNEKDFLTTVHACWGALWSSRALRYMESKNIKAIDTAMSVLVQPLVQAIASGGGISQTADGGMSVTATWGLGESIAQGEVVPDRYDLSEDGKLVDMQTGRKSHTIHCTHHAAPTTKAVAEDEVSKPCLSDAQAEELGAMMKVAEDLKGGPVEIEWAMDDAGIKMLQARPLHTEAAPVPDQIWERHPGMKGQAAGVGWGTGRACVINCECELGRVAPGDVLVTKVAGPAISQVLPKVSGVVAELGGSTTHLASLARERGIPMVLGVLDATNKIPDGGQVAVDGVAGVVRWVPA